jgi:hypothetical protein
MDFKSSNKLNLSTGDYDKEISFNFPAATNATSNDGAIPSGTSPVSAVVTCFKDGDSTAVTSIFVGLPTISGNNVIQSFKYPTEGAGRYYIRFLVTITGGKIVDATFNRVFATDTSDGK